MKIKKNKKQMSNNSYNCNFNYNNNNNYKFNNNNFSNKIWKSIQRPIIIIICIKKLYKKN
jgi:hypothetical protein